LVAYSPAFRAPFIFDDELSVQRNPTIRRLWPPSVPLRPPPGDLAVSGRPVVNYSLALNYAVNERLGIDQRPNPNGRNKAAGYRLLNVLLHLMCGWLIFGIVHRTLVRQPSWPKAPATSFAVAFVVAGLWLLHPIQTEAVNYVVQRTEILASLFFVATLYASIRAWDARSRNATLWWRGAAVLSCCAAMGSKEIAISIPLLVMLYDRAFRLDSWRALVRPREAAVGFYVALFASSGILLILIASGPRSATVGFNHGIAWYEYLYTQAWAISRYLSLVIWPFRLTLDYGQRTVGGLAPWPGFILLFLAGVATVWAWVHAQRWGAWAFLGTWFFLLLGPSSSFVPIASEIAAERRIYLALAAPLVAAAVGLVSAFRPRAGRTRRANAGAPWRGFAIAGAVALLACATITLRRSGQYAHPESLWRESIDRFPDNTRAYNGLAHTLLQQNPPALAEAVPLLQRAMAMDSTFLQPFRTLAAVAISQGQFAAARPLLEHAYSLEKNFEDVGSLLGVVRAATGDLQNAAGLLQNVDLEPLAENDPSGATLLALGKTYMSMQRWADAARAFQRASELDSTGAARLALADALIRLDRPGDAISHLTAVLQANPRSGYGFALLSLAQAKNGHATPAIDAARTALSLAPNEPLVLLLTGRAMLRIGQTGDAETLFAETQRVAPGDPTVLTELALAMSANGKRAAAMALLQKVTAAVPDFAPARQALQQVQRK
jgi:tetratricopeptide (TPR) repeat protein